jgi:hypothetical protein
MMIAIYDILAENNFPAEKIGLAENNFPAEKIGGLALRIIDLAKNNL